MRVRSSGWALWIMLGLGLPACTPAAAPSAAPRPPAAAESLASVPGEKERGSGRAGEPGATEFGGWMLAPDELAVRDSQLTADGRRLFILRGTRWIDHEDGSLERARQVFEEDEVKGLPLPAHLGGGFLFSATVGPATQLWRAPTWTGDLQPLGRIEPPVTQISPGFDRLYLANATSYTLRALDPETGQARDLSPLPLAASYGDMVFADAWTAVVLAGVRGALATFDAGESWHPLGPPAAVLSASLEPSGSIAVSTDSGRFELDASGRLVPTSPSGKDALFDGARTFGRFARQAFPEAPSGPGGGARPLGRRPLRAALLGGWPDTAATAIVLQAGALGRVRLRDGALLSSQPYSGSAPCRGVALGTGFGFVCGDSSGPTEIHAYREQRLTLELRLDGPHRVRSSGNGALVIDAPCALVQRAGENGTTSAKALPSSAEATAGRYCVRQVSGELFDVRVSGDVGVERIAALHDGRVVVLIPPRSSGTGSLSLVTAAGATQQPLTLEPGTGAAARLVRSGLWLDELWEVAPGQLGGWVIGARAFVGVRVGLDGVVQLARLQDGVDETSFFGGRALQFAASASLRETENYGFEWRVSELPPALLTSSSSRPSRRPVRGCTPVGCIHDDWLRVGYGRVEDMPEPVRPEPPARVAFPASGFAFWTLSCVPSGRSPSSARAEAARRRPTTGAEPYRRGAGALPRASSPPGEPPESSAWIGLQDSPPPARRPAELGYDFGESSENGAYRAYAWGPGRADWSRHGHWAVRVGDRFSLDPPWSTAVTRTPWSDASSVAQAFGLDANTGVDWWLRLGPSGELGLLQIRVRSESSLHLLDRDRSITTLQTPQSGDMGTPAGAFAIHDRYYVGASRAEQFQLYRVEQGKLELVATYPLWGRIATQLIGSVQGDEFGLLQKSSGAGWYVVPIDLETFEPRPAFHVSNQQLGRVPPRCEDGRPGWTVVSGVPLTDSSISESNTHLDFSEGAAGLTTKRLSARVVMDEGGLCVDALAALVDTRSREAPRPDPRARRDALPLVVTDPVDDRRWAFSCAP